MRISKIRSLVAVSCVAAIALSGCGGEETAEAAESGADDMEMSTVVEDNRFMTLDADGDSYLDTDEIAEWVDDEGIFTRWDIDRDSEIDEDEIAGNAFQLWDADGNGFVNEEEWVQGTELWYPEGYEVVAIGDIDMDGDSELDSDEFSEAFDVSVLGEIWVEQDLNEETFKNAYFDLYDRNDDGRIDRVEWDAGLALHGIPEN